jgi:2-polyprenyl-3-methyl-5-hydroxy-6-metoxy-1,4-benzoquinol methylase
MSGAPHAAAEAADFAADNRRHCIREDYRPNLVQATYDAEGADAYWTDARIERAALFQHDVYRLAARLAARDELTVLDVGCGPPVKLARMLPARTVVHLVDQPSTAPLAARLLPRARFTPADLETVALDLGRRFDLVVCADVVEHLVDPDPCLRFIRAHLAADGRLLISTPERALLHGADCRACVHPQHVREWTAPEFAAFLHARGFVVERHGVLPQQRVAPWRRWLAAAAWRAGRAPAWSSCQYALCRAA